MKIEEFPAAARRAKTTKKVYHAPGIGMFRHLKRRALLVALAAAPLLLTVAAAACFSPKNSGDASSTHPQQMPSPISPQALWGDLKPVVSVKELMRDMLDPASDNSIVAIKVPYTETATIETKPTTEQDRDRIRIGAVTLAEGVYLLKIPRPFAPAGDENNSTG